MGKRNGEKKGRTVIVTGGNQGIGYYLAGSLLQEGNRVAVLDRETENLTDFQERYGENFVAHLCNACRFAYLPFEETEDAIFQAVLGVNLYGARHLAAAVLPYMKKQRSGRLIFTSSGVGVTGFENVSPYAVSKGGIEALAKCLELEYRRYGISVHLFHPPLTQTRSSSLLPVPAEFMATPQKVGEGLARHIDSRRFVICHSLLQQFQMRLCYLWPLTMGGLMCRMTERAKNF